MKYSIATVALVIAISLSSSAFAQFGSGTTAGFGPSGEATGTATYQGELGFAHSIADQKSGFVRSSAVGVSGRGEISYSRSLMQRQGIQTTGTNLQVLNSDRGSHLSGGQVTSPGSPTQIQVGGQSQMGPGGIRGGATVQGQGAFLKGNTFATTRQSPLRIKRPFISRTPIWKP